MTQQLVVTPVDNPMKAREMLMAASRLAKHGKLGIDDAVILSKTKDGKAHPLETTDKTPAEGGLGGAFWGLLFGALLAGPVGGQVTGAVTGGAGALRAKVIDKGTSDDFITEMENLLEPGHGAPCLLANYIDYQAAVHELNRFDGKLIWSNLPLEVAAEINATMAHDPADQAIPVTGILSSAAGEPGGPGNGSPDDGQDAPSA